MTQPKAGTTISPIDGPAILRSEHKQDRIISPVAGAPKAWRSECQLEAARDQGRLDDPGSKWTAFDRFAAAKRYQEIFDITESSGGRDSTQAMNVSRSSRPGQGSDTRERAWDLRLSLESRLSHRDRIVIRSVCGEGHAPSVGVALISPGYKHTVWARFREALDSLCEAFEQVRKQPGVFSMERRA